MSIHNYDLSYTYDANTNSDAGENKKFKRTCILLLKDLVDKINKLDLNMSFIDLFHGRWNSEFDKEITFSKDGKYFIKGEHWFNIIDFKIDIKNNSFQFVKCYIDNPKKRIINKLEVISLGKYYKGVELKGDREINISYKAVD